MAAHSGYAARIHESGPPGMLVIEELPRPAPGHGEVLVRVATAGVGRLSLAFTKSFAFTNCWRPTTYAGKRKRKPL